jgi:hypothetical protein
VLLEIVNYSTASYVASNANADQETILTMMSFSLFNNPTMSPPRQSTTEANDDDQTVMAGENRSSGDRELKEICVKWVFPMTGDKKKALQSHCTMLSMILKAFPDIVIIDNKAREHTDHKSIKPTEQHRPFDFYADLRNSRRRTLVCIHRIRTSHSFAELKEAWGVFEELKKQKAYVRPHAFGEKDREISHLGFIPGVSMINVPKEVVKQEILTMLKQHASEIPRFELVQVRVDMGKNSKGSERTRAYEIQCIQRDASRLAKMLQSGVFKEKPVYIPYHMKRSNTAVFKKAIKRQIKTLSCQWVIKINGFTDTMIDCIRDKVLESWAEAIVPTKNTSRGEWKILVDREAHTPTMTWLSEHWADVMELIPAEVLEASPFDNPKIMSRAKIPEDGSEEGTVDTYGTILSSLYGGTGNEDEESEVSDIEPSSTTFPARPVSYAQVIRDGNISTVSQVSGWTDSKTDELTKLQEKHSTLEEKFQFVTAELSELKILMNQLIAQGKAQAGTGPPQKRQATFDTPNRADRQKPTNWLQQESMDMEYGPDETDPEAGNSS